MSMLPTALRRYKIYINNYF